MFGYRRGEVDVFVLLECFVALRFRKAGPSIVELFSMS
jgi:hypothetical protein